MTQTAVIALLGSAYNEIIDIHCAIGFHPDDPADAVEIVKYINVLKLNHPDIFPHLDASFDIDFPVQLELNLNS